MILQVVGDCVFLVIRHGEYIAEATATEDLLFASALGFEHSRAWIDLRCPDSGNIGTCCRERRVKPDPCRGRATCTKDKASTRRS